MSVTPEDTDEGEEQQEPQESPPPSQEGLRRSIFFPDSKNIVQFFDDHSFDWTSYSLRQHAVQEVAKADPSNI